MGGAWHPGRCQPEPKRSRGRTIGKNRPISMPGFGGARKRGIRSLWTFGSWRMPDAIRPASVGSDVGRRFCLATAESVLPATGTITMLRRPVRLLQNGRRGSLRIRPQRNSNAADGRACMSLSWTALHQSPPSGHLRNAMVDASI